LEETQAIVINQTVTLITLSVNVRVKIFALPSVRFLSFKTMFIFRTFGKFSYHSEIFSYDVFCIKFKIYLVVFEQFQIESTIVAYPD